MYIYIIIINNIIVENSVINNIIYFNLLSTPHIEKICIQLIN